jgi:hypothetical protein
MDDNIRFAIITGCSPYTPDPFTEAIAERFDVIRDGELFSKKEGEYLYEGNRTLGENLGWRFAQEHGEFPISEITDGKHDDKIADTYHIAASSEHWYAFHTRS